MKNLSLRTQQAILIGLVGLTCLGVGAAYWTQSNVHTNLELAFQRHLALLAVVPDLQDRLRRIDQTTDEFLLSGSRPWLEQRLSNLRELRALLADLDALFQGESEKQAMEAMGRKLEASLAEQERWIARKQAGAAPPADHAKIAARRRIFEELLEPLLAIKGASLRRLERRRHASASAARWTLGLIVAMGAAASTLIALLLTWLIVRPISRLEAYARTWQLGTPWQGEAPEASPEIRGLSRSMQEMAERLNLQHGKELELSRFKTRLVSLISHEVGNALATIQGASGVLQETEGGPPEEREHLYRMLAGNVRSLALGMQNILNMGRIESGRFAMNPRPTDVRALLRESLEQLDILRLRKGIEIRLEFDEAPLARADPDALSLVLTNLLGNAIKYTPQGGRITVGIRREGAQVRVAVSDSGIGISREETERVLAGYYRTERGIAAAKGFGIGLSLVQQILEAHESRLEIESQPGKGSRFSFLLAACDPDPRPGTA